VFQINDLVGLYTNVEAGSLKASKNPDSLDKWQNGDVTNLTLDTSVCSWHEDSTFTLLPNRRSPNLLLYPHYQRPLRGNLQPCVVPYPLVVGVNSSNFVVRILIIKQ
jgi:hypothetical protein